MALQLVLQMAGHDVRLATDGLAALALAEQWRPEAAVVDIGLPGDMDGYQLAGSLRGLLGAQVRLVALTGLSADSDRRLGHEAGFDAFLVKPVPPEDVQRSLE